MVFVISSIPPPNILFPFISNQKQGVNLFLNLIINWCNKLNLILWDLLSLEFEIFNQYLKTIIKGSFFVSCNYLMYVTRDYTNFENSRH